MKKNIILLSIDALRADHCSCYGYDRETTPNIDAIAEEGVRFENAFSASSHTREAVPSLLTGQHPDDSVAADFTLKADTIAVYLDDEYETGAFHSNPYVSRAYGFDRDFDHFDDDLTLGRYKFLAIAQRALNKYVFNRGRYHARASEINERSLEWLDSLADDRPFFLWNHYMDVHGPYNPPQSFSKWTDVRLSDDESQAFYDEFSANKEVPEADLERARDLYDGEIAYVDHCIGQLVGRLRDLGVWEESTVIVTADHGELFGEHSQTAHPRRVYPELTAVPLLVRESEITPEAVPTPTSTLDVLPTILDRLDHSEESLPGTSLCSLDDRTDDRFVFSSALSENGSHRRFAIHGPATTMTVEREIETGTITDEALRRRDDGPTGASSHYQTTDRHEQLRKRLLDHSELRLAGVSRAEEESPVDPEIERRLSALGYK